MLLPFVVMLLPLFPVAQPTPPPAGNLKVTLEKLDAASAKFSSAEARVHRDNYLAIIKSIDDQSEGSIYFLRDKGATKMGLKTEGPKGRTIEFRAGTLRVFNPGPDCFDTVTRPGIETYLTLGFGGSGKDLAKAWDITDLGPETVDGKKVEHLDLVAKDAAVRSNYKKVSLWLDLDRDVTLKQIFYSATTGDTNTAYYTHIEVNQPVKLDKYSFKGKPCGK